MADLSPAAKAILEMVNAAPHCGSGRIKAAAALRAAADQVVPKLAEPQGTGFRWGGWAAKQGARRELLAIAAELEGQ